MSLEQALAALLPRLPLLGALLLGLFIGAAVMYLRAQSRINEILREQIRLDTELRAERQLAKERQVAALAAQRQQSDHFAALAASALRRNNHEFLQLARENLQGFQMQARSELDSREKAIETLIQPIREALDRTEQQVRAMEQARDTAFTALTEHLRHLAGDQQRLRDETHRLVRALSQPTVRGQWGELTLKRLVELAGMVDHCDFEQQVQRDGEGGRLRPDMVVRMPEARALVVDAKTPLDAYLAAMEADDPRRREEHLMHHARKLRERMRELAGKSYWAQFQESPDFVILFIPGDQFLSAALEKDPGLLEDALSNRVILATPSSLVALLRAVAYGWRQQTLARNAEQIRVLGEELHQRVAIFSEHLFKLGRHLGSSVEQYNRALASLERQLMPSMRRFAELGIQEKKPLSELQPLDQKPNDPRTDQEPS